MASVIVKVQDILKASTDSNSQFYRDYEKFTLMYQELLDKGVVSKRQSQLLSITDKAAIASMHYNQPE
jgi:chemotaxis methyl-accepting protein methylase